jgi:hypothetical protein
MKKILGLIIISLLFNSLSYADKCIRDDAFYTLDETDENISEDLIQKEIELLERTYIFALDIQKAVKEKDMDKIYSYLDEGMPYQNKNDFKDKLFDEVFTEEHRDEIISDTVDCTRFNHLGWILGNGIIWYSNKIWDPDNKDNRIEGMSIIALRGLYQGE